MCSKRLNHHVHKKHLAQTDGTKNGEAVVSGGEKTCLDQEKHWKHLFSLSTQKQLRTAKS